MYDYKEWIQQRAEELAQEIHGKDYDSLSSVEQINLWSKAEQEYWDKHADRIDALYEAYMEDQMMERMEHEQGITG